MWPQVARAVLVGVLGLVGLVVGTYCVWGVFALNIFSTTSLDPPDYGTPSETTFALGAVACAVVPPVVAAVLYRSARRPLLVLAGVLLVLVAGLVTYIGRA